MGEINANPISEAAVKLVSWIFYPSGIAHQGPRHAGAAWGREVEWQGVEAGAPRHGQRKGGRALAPVPGTHLASGLETMRKEQRNG
jgi:hypothetical protein